MMEKEGGGREERESALLGEDELKRWKEAARVAQHVSVKLGWDWVLLPTCWVNAVVWLASQCSASKLVAQWVLRRGKRSARGAAVTFGWNWAITE